MNNKELIDKLQAYLLTQNPEIVTRLLANCLVDFAHIDLIDYLPRDEVDCLCERIKRNAELVREFAKKDTHEPLTLGSLK